MKIWIKRSFNKNKNTFSNHHYDNSNEYIVWIKTDKVIFDNKLTYEITEYLNNLTDKKENKQINFNEKKVN